MFNKITDLIGNTPLIKINNIIENEKLDIFGKLESFNPGGSIKDRIALNMITQAEKRKELDKSKTIIEASSGNTAIGLALVSKIKEYNFTAVMSKAVSKERIKILRSYDADIILTSENEKTDGAIKKVIQLVNKHPEKYFTPDQFTNRDNYLTHYKSTGPEIWNQMNGSIDYFFAGIGTSGTIRGISKYLKEKNRSIKIVGVLPERNHRIQGLKNMSESITPKIYDESFIDDFIYVNTEKSYEYARKLSLEEGILGGMSSGATIYGIKKYINRKNGIEGNIVTIIPDGGEKYLTTNLFLKN